MAGRRSCAGQNYFRIASGLSWNGDIQTGGDAKIHDLGCVSGKHGKSDGVHRKIIGVRGRYIHYTGALHACTSL